MSGTPTTHASERSIVIVEGKPSASAPYHTLAKALERLGHSVRVVPVGTLGRGEWRRDLRSARAIVLLHYQALDGYLLSQLAMAVALGVPVIRWWVGTDVLNVITSRRVWRSALQLDRIVSGNVAVAPHLLEELGSAGIHAQYVPSVLDPELEAPDIVSWTNTPRPVLVYLPDSRKAFYGFDEVERAIAANPDVRFIILADRTHSLAGHPNVESLGWVTDMRGVYDRAGCILRVTEHDGLPRMLMEGVLRGMYAIYAWPLAGCWMARTPEEIQRALERYRTMAEPNAEGRAAMLALRDSRPDEQMARIISSATVSLATRARALALAARTGLVG